MSVRRSRGDSRLANALYLGMYDTGDGYGGKVVRGVDESTGFHNLHKEFHFWPESHRRRNLTITSVHGWLFARVYNGSRRRIDSRAYV